MNNEQSAAELLGQLDERVEHLEWLHRLATENNFIPLAQQIADDLRDIKAWRSVLVHRTKSPWFRQ